MVRFRVSIAQDYPEPNPPVESPPSSPTRRARAFYHHPSGSRFTEDEVSAILSDATSLAVPNNTQPVSAWASPRAQPTRLQKLRRAPQKPLVRPPPVRTDDIPADSESDATSSSWTAASIPTPEPSSPPGPPHPVSFRPAPHPAESFTEYDRLQVRSGETPSLVLLRAVAPEQSLLCSTLLHTSLLSNRDTMRDIIPQRNGFVDTVIEAYNNHRGLIVRPDDVWLAIVMQFSFFVNGHTEAFRKVFAAHERRHRLVVESGGSRYSMDTEFVGHRMAALMEEQIVDPSIREWIIPNFTTTTAVDKMTCTVAMMGMTKNYPAYKHALRCGIPKVTLEGEQKDWQAILHRTEHLRQYSIQTIAWYHLLRPILARFVNAYDHPAHPDNLDFWNKIAYPESGSGVQRLSGWITAFCVFNERGRWQGNTLNEERIREHEPKKLLRPADPLQLTPSQFVTVYTIRERTPYLSLDGFPYPTIESQDVPCGYVYLDVTLTDDAGAVETMLIAGLVGSQICSTEKTELFRNGLRDTVRPVSAWWYLVKQEARDGARSWG